MTESGPRTIALPRAMPSLDGLRGIAILLVLAHQLDPSRGVTGPASHAVHLALNLGWIGVQLFFVLSGFLITGILLETKHSPRYLPAFFGRRVLRIFPLYYLTLLVVFVVVPLLGGAAVPFRDQVVLWTYVVNWTAPFGIGAAVLPHFWSLAVEEQFYLVWPFVVRRASAQGIARLALALVVIALGARGAVLVSGISEEAAYMFTVCRMDALALGALLAAAVREPSLAAVVVARRRRIVALTTIAAAVGFVATRGDARTSPLGQTIGYTTLGIGFAGLVLAAALADVDGRGPLRAALTFAPLRAIGQVSYGMYVFHLPLNAAIGAPLLARMVPAGAPVGAAVAAVYVASVSVATYAAAWLSYQLVERRFLALKDRFEA